MSNPPSTAHSLTSSDSFRLRVQRSELIRTRLTAAIFAAILLLMIARRAAGGIVMAENALFFPIIAILLAALAAECLVELLVRRHNRNSTLLPDAFWWIAGALELAVPIAILSILTAGSPRGHIVAISGPSLLPIPILILMSILHVRPRFTFALGLLAALAHACIVTYAVLAERPDLNMYPVLYSYSLMILLAGIGATMVASQVKSYIRQTVGEAIAIEEANRRIAAVEHDLTIARDIQRNLMPASPPIIPGYTIAGMSRPADFAGGDYYDWHDLPDGRLAVAIADVTGHGIGPAIVMAVCRAYSRATAPLVDSLSSLLGRLNAMIHADVGGTRFITLAVAFLEPDSNKIRLLSAGHGPTFHYHAASNSVTSYDGDGCPLGVLHDEQYLPEHTLHLQPNDVLLLLTDGFFECPRPADGALYGTDRIEELLKHHAEKSPDQLLQQLDQSVLTYAAGQKQQDDMTAVAIKRH